MLGELRRRAAGTRPAGDARRAPEVDDDRLPAEARRGRTARRRASCRRSAGAGLPRSRPARPAVRARRVTTTTTTPRRSATTATSERRRGSAVGAATVGAIGRAALAGRVSSPVHQGRMDRALELVGAGLQRRDVVDLRSSTPGSPCRRRPSPRRASRMSTSCGVPGVLVVEDDRERLVGRRRERRHVELDALGDDVVAAPPAAVRPGAPGAAGRRRTPTRRRRRAPARRRRRRRRPRREPADVERRPRRRRRGRSPDRRADLRPAPAPGSFSRWPVVSASTIWRYSLRASFSQPSSVDDQ